MHLPDPLLDKGINNGQADQYKFDELDQVYKERLLEIK
jgi:hypothetical protein